MSEAIKTELLEELRKLDEPKQQKLLEFARSLRTKLPPGVPGKELLKFAGTISKEDLKLMKEAIEEGCEQVYPSEW